MPTENKPDEPLPSLATGAELNTATWTDFVERLRYDCNGAGVKWHHTAAALFTVQTKRIDYGFEPDYAEGLVVCREDCSGSALKNTGRTATKRIRRS
ncbi:hypothetical protein [Pseudomonas sp. NPDC086278]|uniref:hypothetical protein n=1 Tax=Pseudomonas sp. NPDC086278 TaxID=3390646 RepID=UPI003D06EFB1